MRDLTDFVNFPFQFPFHGKAPMTFTVPRMLTPIATPASGQVGVLIKITGVELLF